MVVLDANSADIAGDAQNIVDNVLDENMVFLMNSYMIPEVVSAAHAANLPESFVAGIKFVKTGNNEGDIINTWGSKKKPLALWFNYGTKDHGALGNWTLRWKGMAGTEIHAKYVRGLPKTLAMEIGIELGQKRLKQEVPNFVEARLE